jgi:hypothetical protein
MKQRPGLAGGQLEPGSADRPLELPAEQARQIDDLESEGNVLLVRQGGGLY